MTLTQQLHDLNRRLRTIIDTGDTIDVFVGHSGQVYCQLDGILTIEQLEAVVARIRQVIPAQ